MTLELGNVFTIWKKFHVYYCQKLNDFNLFTGRKVRSVKCGTWFFILGGCGFIQFLEWVDLSVERRPDMLLINPYNVQLYKCNALYVMSTVISFYTIFDDAGFIQCYTAPTVSVPYYWPNDHTYAETWQNSR